MCSAVLTYIALRPVLGLGHELVVAAVAQLTRLIIGMGVWEPLIQLFGLDPIYFGAAMRALGGVNVDGFAIAGPVGSLLHAVMPAVFQPPELAADGAAISMVAAAGSPAIGRAAAAFGADVMWLSVGLGLFWRQRRRSWRWALIGLMIQAQIATNHLLNAQVSIGDLDASGLPFAVALAFSNVGWFTTGWQTISPPLRDALSGVALVVLGYICSVSLVALVRALTPRRFRHAASGTALTIGRPPLALALAVAFMTAWSPIGALAVGESNWQLAPAALVTPAPRHGRLSHALRLHGATRVAVTPNSNGGWQYLVDGVPETIRGVGYNPQYAGQSDADRTAVYERDFAEMSRLGINTIEGWFEGQFDGVTLDAAAHNGIGVMMPFELNQDWPFENPNVQQSVLDHVSAYVEKYKNHPAVRMWAPGNENLHRILYARFVSQENVPAARERADAFAAFLPRLVDRIHELDPDHPVIYRDAEDVYLGRVTAAFSRDGVERPWLVYGANVYSPDRLRQIIAQWPAQWPGRALVISEFAPGGVAPAERPAGFRQQWAIIRSRPDMVLGGLAYTWATNGPEDLDRVFGLVDPRGVPTDGALTALTESYLGEPW